jgi:hypothetical protein
MEIPRPRANCHEVNMKSHDALIARIQGEYGEMPGLRLSLAQACRLWQVDVPTCTLLLEQLVRDAFLLRTHDGFYIALPASRRQVKAPLSHQIRVPQSA